MGADTGPMHLAWSVGCPVVALFGPTDPRLNAPLGPGHVILKSGNSMAGITPGQAFEAAHGLLPRRPATAGSAAPRLSRATLFPRAAGAGR